jgi:hypothetical protein
MIISEQGKISNPASSVVASLESIRFWARVMHHPASELELLGMFESYFDESGIHSGAKMFVLAGYLAPAKEWEQFVPEWQAVLDKFDIQVFHANQCNGSKGEFKKFKDRREERNEFVAELLSTISDRPLIIPFCVGVAYEDFPDAPVLPCSNHPYHVGINTLLAMIGLYMRQIKPYPLNERVGCVFDRQAQFSGSAIRHFNELLDDQDWTDRRRFDGIGYASKDKSIPLQAADALAFDCYLEFIRKKYYPERKPRPSYAVLTKNLAILPQIWDIPAVEHLMETERLLNG